MLIERVKKFVRKINKSNIQREEFSNIQKLNELPKLSLIKHAEIRWSSTFNMLDRFLINKQAIVLLSANDPTLPKFSGDDWLTIDALKKILSPIYEATKLLQNRACTIGTVIPLFRVIKYALEKNEGGYNEIRKAIILGLVSRMEEKRGSDGRVKRVSWNDNRELILATILDPRFKLSKYLDIERHNEYKKWLISEAEKAFSVMSRPSFSSTSSNDKTSNDYV